MTAEFPAPPALRVLHVSDSYLPTLGGIELHVADLVARQRRRGQDASVLTRTPETSVDDGVVLARAAGRTRFSAPRATRLAQALSGRAGYDVVHVHASVYSPWAWRATLTRAELGLPVVFTAHSMLTGVVGPYRAAATLLRLRRLPVIWSAVSTAAARSLADALGWRDRPLRVLPNAVDPAYWHRPAVLEEPDPVTFVAVMRLAARKRPHALLEAFRTAGAPSAARLLIVGDGPRHDACRRWCGAHPASNVTLLGRLDRSQIRALLHQADVFLAPATRESFGIAALEARESGLPVVARSGTGVADFVDHGVHGLLVGSDAEMADAIRTLTNDRPLLRKLTAATQERSSGYDWPHAMAAADAAYRDAVVQAGDRGPGPRFGHTAARERRW